MVQGGRAKKFQGVGQLLPISAPMTQIKEETLLVIILLITGKISLQRKTNLMPICSPLDPQISM